MCVVASHIDDAVMFRAGAIAGALGRRVMARSMLGTFLRSFTVGHFRRMEAVIGHATGTRGQREPDLATSRW